VISLTLMSFRFEASVKRATREQCDSIGLSALVDALKSSSQMLYGDSQKISVRSCVDRKNSFLRRGYSFSAEKEAES